MNKTLKDNKLDVEFLERVVKDWREDIYCNSSKEFKTIDLMLDKKDYEKWECIYTNIVAENKELSKDYHIQLDKIQDYDSEIRLEEYFDNAITLYVKTKGLFICKEIKEDEIGNGTQFRITLYKYNDSDHKMVGKE